MRLLFTALACLISMSSFGQNINCDIIETRNGERIEAKILEFSSQETKYKMCDYVDGPTKIINNREIYQIEYANGIIDIINTKKTEKKPKKNLSDKSKKILDEKINSKIKYEWKFGVLSGLNASNVIFKGENLHPVLGAELKSSEHRLGLHAGCFMSKNLNFRISYTSELLFTQKGYTGPHLFQGWWWTWHGQQTDNNDFGYLASSNYLNYSLGMVNLFAGIEVSYLLYARIIEQNGHALWGTEHFSNFDYSSIGGICINTKSNLAFSIRYINGFISIKQDLVFTDEIGTTISSIKPLNRTWSLSVLYNL